MSKTEAPLAGALRGLEYRFPETDRDVLTGATLAVKRGARVLLTGQNGAGKTTLLRIWAGKNLVARGTAMVQKTTTGDANGELIDAFEASLADVRYLGGQWAMRLEGGRFGTPFEGDIRVAELVRAEVGSEITDAAVAVARLHTKRAAESGSDSNSTDAGDDSMSSDSVEDDIGAVDAPYLDTDDTMSKLFAAARSSTSPSSENSDPVNLIKRIGSLLFTLDIDVRWRMHRVSDGQRRRVQILMALFRPFNFLLLDEVTVDLDLLVRAQLLDWIKVECEQRGSAVVYATHIFDGLGGWVTDVAHLFNGTVTRAGPVESFADQVPVAATVQAQQAAGGILNANSALLSLVESWLKADQRAQATEDTAEQEAPHARDGEASKKDHIIHMPAGHGGSRFYNYWG